MVVQAIAKTLTNPSTHIVILCSRLDLPGGIERAVVNTANLFASKGHQVTLVILDETNTSFYPIDSAIKTIQQPLSFGITVDGNVITRKIRLLTDVLRLKKLFRQLQPSLIIASEYPLAAGAILTGIRKRATIVSWEHHHFYELKRNFFWEKVFQLTYPKLHAVVCLNDDERKLFQIINPNPVVIPNFITLPSLGRHRLAAGDNLQHPTSNIQHPTILTIARLATVKGTDLLLQCAKTVLQRNPGWKWKLIGDGEMKEETTRFIEKEQLENQLILQAPVNHDIMSEYQLASLYVMTSRNECFPMTLLEAQSAGLPCIAFDCETGPRHIIIPNENGILIEKENVAKMAEEIERLIKNTNARDLMSTQAIRNTERFSSESIYLKWKKIIDNN